MPPHSNEHPHRLDNGANTPLLAAATQCDLKGVQRGLLSIEDVAPLLAADFETGSTALHRACECTDDQHIIGLERLLPVPALGAPRAWTPATMLDERRCRGASTR